MTVKVDMTLLLRMLDEDIQQLIERGRATEQEMERDRKFYAEAFERIGDKAVQKIEDVVRSLDTWSGSNVMLTGRPAYAFGHDYYMTEDGDPADDFEVFVHKGAFYRNAPSFTWFGGNEHVDDILDAGDSDFFDDPEVEADYFALVGELRHPGEAKRKGERVTILYTARPTKDRHLYENAKNIPVNVFLTTDPDEAWGYARDLGGDRDIYRIRVKRKYLILTLDSGRVKNYQTFAGKQRTVPVEACDLIQEGSRLAYRVLARCKEHMF